MKKRLSVLLFVTVFLSMCGCGKDQNAVINLSAETPVAITVRHDYSGVRQMVFDELITEFNATEGLEKGIYIDQESESEELPNIISADIISAFELKKQGGLADISPYVTEEELAGYMESYVEEGKIGSGDELWIFPIARSAEVLMINKTDWEIFAAETGAELTKLATWEGLAGMAQEFYEWTDEKTPNIPEDGRAFYGRDGMTDLFVGGSVQLGSDIFEVADGQVTLHVDKEVMKRIWDFYYSPYIKGYFKSFGRFRSDDLKIGEIIAYTGAADSTLYFPDEVETSGENYSIDGIIMPVPLFEGGESFCVQQGEGMVITKASPEEEYASAIFLKWLTQKENNIALNCAFGYLPVLQSAYHKMSLDIVTAERGLDIKPETYDTILMKFENVLKETVYINQAFEGRAGICEVLENHLQDKAGADRKAVEELLAAGTDLESAAAGFLTDEAFEKWYGDFCEALEDAAKKGNELK